jgi:putative transposase
MPRRRRVGSGGVIFHVINRGAKRSQLFDNSSEYSTFENLLRITRHEAQIPLFAYCLMPNHWHLVLRPEKDGALSTFMHDLTGTHAQQWNAGRNASGQGAVYQGRFKAIPVQCDVYFLRLCRYVERNPIRAGLVPRAGDWQWSSLWRRLNNCADGLLADWPIARPEPWIELLDETSSDQETDDIRSAIRGSVPYGSEPWREDTAELLNLAPVERHRGRPKKKGAAQENLPTLF